MRETSSARQQQRRTATKNQNEWGSIPVTSSIMPSQPHAELILSPPQSFMVSGGSYPPLNITHQPSVASFVPATDMQPYASRERSQTYTDIPHPQSTPYEMNDSRYHLQQQQQAPIGASMLYLGMVQNQPPHDNMYRGDANRIVRAKATIPQNKLQNEPLINGHVSSQQTTIGSSMSQPIRPRYLTELQGEHMVNGSQSFYPMPQQYQRVGIQNYTSQYIPAAANPHQSPPWERQLLQNNNNLNANMSTNPDRTQAYYGPVLVRVHETGQSPRPILPIPQHTHHLPPSRTPSPQMSGQKPRPSMDPRASYKSSSQPHTLPVNSIPPSSRPQVTQRSASFDHSPASHQVGLSHPPMSTSNIQANHATERPQLVQPQLQPKGQKHVRPTQTFIPNGGSISARNIRPLPLVGPPPPGYEPIGPIRSRTASLHISNLVRADAGGQTISTDISVGEIAVGPKHNPQPKPLDPPRNEVASLITSSPTPKSPSPLMSLKSLMKANRSPPNKVLDRVASPASLTSSTASLRLDLLNTPALSFDDFRALESDLESICESFSNTPRLNIQPLDESSEEHLGTMITSGNQSFPTSPTRESGPGLSKSKNLPTHFEKELSKKRLSKGLERDIMEEWEKRSRIPMTRSRSADGIISASIPTSSPKPLHPQRPHRPIKLQNDSLGSSIVTPGMKSSPVPLIEHGTLSDTHSRVSAQNEVPPPSSSTSKSDFKSRNIKPKLIKGDLKQLPLAKTITSPTSPTTRTMLIPSPRTSKNKSPYLISVGKLNESEDLSESLEMFGLRAAYQSSKLSEKRVGGSSSSSTPNLESDVPPSQRLSKDSSNNNSPRDSKISLKTSPSSSESSHPSKPLSLNTTNIAPPAAQSSMFSEASNGIVSRCDCASFSVQRMTTVLSGKSFLSNPTKIRRAIENSCSSLDLLNFYIMPLEGDLKSKKNQNKIRVGELHVSVFASSAQSPSQQELVHGIVLTPILDHQLELVAVKLHSILRAIQMNRRGSQGSCLIHFIKPETSDRRAHICSTCRSYKFRGPTKSTNVHTENHQQRKIVSHSSSSQSMLTRSFHSVA